MRPPKMSTLTNSCGTQVRVYPKIPAVPTVNPFFFLSAHGKAEILIANYPNSKAEAPQASVFFCAGAIGHNVLPI